MMFFVVLRKHLWVILLFAFASNAPALEEALGNPSTAVSDSSGSAVPVEQWLEAALQLRESKPALFGEALGVLIVSVLPDSQAAEKGLRPGDIVTAYAGEAMNSAEQLVKAVQAKASEARVVVRFIRGEKVEEIALKGGKIEAELKNIRSPQSAEFAEQLVASTNDNEKFIQLIRDNPKLAKQIFPSELLIKIGQLRPELDRIQNEGKQAYSQFNYSFALEKWEGGLTQARHLGDKRYISQFLGNLGMVYRDLGQYDKALEYHQLSLTIYKELGDKYGVGNNLNSLGLVSNDLGLYSKALEYYQQSWVLAKELGDKDAEGGIMSNRGAAYKNLGQYPKALEYFQQALAIHKELNDKHEEGIDLGNLGVISDDLGQYHKALEYHQRALVIYEELDNKSLKGRALSNLGVVHQNLGQSSKASEYYQQALDIARKFGDKHGEWSVLTNLGAAYENLGQYHKAIEYHKQALDIAKKFANKRGIGSVLTNLGYVYQCLSQYPKALEYLQQALVIDKEFGDKHGEGRDLVNLGTVYWSLGQYDKALEYNQQALNIFRELSDKPGEGIILTNFGVVYSELGQYTKALEYNQQALNIYRELGDERLKGRNLSNLGLVYGKSGQYTKALEHSQQALAIGRELSDKRGEADDLINLGGHYWNLGQYDKAQAHFQDSVTILESLGSLSALWRAQGNLAFTEVLLKQPKEAIQHYEQALEILEQLRTSLTSSLESSGIAVSEIKTQFMKDKFHIYDEFITLLQTEHPKHPDKGYDRKAFEVFEKKQGRVFLEQMGKSTAWRFTGVPEEITAKDRELENQVTAARKNLSDAYAKGKDVDPSPFRQHLETVEKEQLDFEEKLKADYPNYYALKYPKPVKLDDLQKNVLQDDEIVLIYNVRKEATDLWLIGKQQFQMFSLPLSEAQITEQVTEFRKWGIDRADTTGSPQDLADSLERDFADFTKASRALYQHLFPQAVRDLLGQAKPKLLYIVPTSALYELPFEALITDNADKPHYLIQEYAISYLSSASLLKTLRDAKSKDSQTQRKERQPLLAFADPTYPKQDCDLKLLDNSIAAIQVKAYYESLSGGGLDKNGCPIKLSASEAKGIANLLEVDLDDSSLITEDEASRKTVLTVNELENSQYVIFSTHGLLPKEITPLIQPALLLSHKTPLEQEKDEDGEMVLKGFLTMSDVFRLKMNADLVMLSACNTGLGEKTKGEGTIGLTRAFMYAGTPAVSITLWSVESKATKELNVGWFKRLQEKQSLADSLRAAKLDMLNLEMLDKKDYYRYPYAWAGIVVFGDGK